jgi:peptide-methionine (R)-S-oxide reductase
MGSGWLTGVLRRTFGVMSTHTGPMPDARPDGSPYAVTKSDEEWRAELSPAEYAVLREAGTERAFVGEYTDTKTRGTYSCRACNAVLFTSDTKFDSHCGWPSFWSPLAGDTVVEIEDTSLGMRRVEVRCASCGSHLGHVFSGEGYGTPTDQRYCINSISLRLEPVDD